MLGNNLGGRGQREMKLTFRWPLVPTAIALVLAIATAVHGQPVQTPLSAPVLRNGTTGATEAGSCGFIPNAPSQVVVVSSPTALRFNVRGEGQPTLMIAGPGVPNRCAMADNQSGGVVEVPGYWSQGTYSLFIGNRTRGTFPYTLSITQEN